MLRLVGNFLFSAANPFSGIRADLCVVMLVRLEHMMNDVGIDVHNCLPSLCIVVHIPAWFDEAGPDRLTRTLTRDWFHA